MFPKNKHFIIFLKQNKKMQANQKTQKDEKVPSTHLKRNAIENTNNFKYYEPFKLMVSQPHKYFMVQAVIFFGMVYYYALTFATGLLVREINYVVIVLNVFVELFFIILGFKNPGIILKISQDFETQTRINIPFDRDAKPAVNQLAKSYAFPIKSHFIGLKVCPQCLIYKPPRTVHCWICNACISNMDHHCPFIGNCVGKGNYQIFFCFVSTLGCMLVLIISQLIILVVRIFQNYQKNGFEKPELYFAIILILFAVVVLVFVGTLGSFHIYLITNNITTNQLCKQTWNTISGNPFKKNFCTKNIMRFIRGPSKQLYPHTSEQLQKPMIPRFKNRSEECLSSYTHEQNSMSRKITPKNPQKPERSVDIQISNTHQQIFTRNMGITSI